MVSYWRKQGISIMLAPFQATFTLALSLYSVPALLSDCVLLRFPCAIQKFMQILPGDRSPSTATQVVSSEWGVQLFKQIIGLFVQPPPLSPQPSLSFLRYSSSWYFGHWCKRKRRVKEKWGEEGGWWELPREDPLSLGFQLQQEGGGETNEWQRKEGSWAWSWDFTNPFRSPAGMNRAGIQPQLPIGSLAGPRLSIKGGCRRHCLH